MTLTPRQRWQVLGWRIFLSWRVWLVTTAMSEVLDGWPAVVAGCSPVVAFVVCDLLGQRAERS